MAADDLTAPLRGKRKTPGRRLPFMKVAGALLVFVVATVGGWILLNDDPLGGDPVATAPVERTASAIVSGDSGKPANAAALQAAADARPAAPAGQPQQPQTGPGGQIIRSGPGNSKIISLPDSGDGGDVVISRDTGTAALGDAAFVEKSGDGPLPRIAPDGRRPMDAYARPVDSFAVGTARVAIVIGGLGISEGATKAALQQLPPEISLAFTPYGRDLPSTIARARQDGHEILLQVPLEPFDYPNNDPGPRTLLATAAADENLGRLRWVMSRATGYVGLLNFMGSRFTADLEAMKPVLAEIGKRGLLYVDDGASTQSRAREAAGGRVPFAGADLIIDPILEGPAIDERMSQLEAIARERGHAIGVASGFPLTVERVALWAKAAARRGVILVPISSLAEAKPS